MEIISDPKVLQEICLSHLRGGKETALVPTMGFLHQGHVSLMELANKNAEKVIASIFVNPTQFGPDEDLEAYPRDLEKDVRTAEAAGVDILFTPKAQDLYLDNFSTWVESPVLSKPLCGRSRPVHFKGVCTVVSKLFHLAMPTCAVFGQKDWQQLAIIKHMVRDLDFPVKILGAPIFREDDGLAMSSRNRYLTEEERSMAPALNKGLRHIASLVKSGETTTRLLKEKLELFYAAHLAMATIDYIEFVHPDILEPMDEADGPTLLAVAVRLGKARLIDNIVLNP